MQPAKAAKIADMILREVDNRSISDDDWEEIKRHVMIRRKPRVLIKSGDWSHDFELNSKEYTEALNGLIKSGQKVEMVML